MSALLLGALCLIAPGDVRAEDAVSEDAVELRLSELRTYVLPEDFTLERAQVTTAEDGRVFYAANTGTAQAMAGGVANTACTVVVVDDHGARALSYRYQDKPTGCLGVRAHPDGGFFIRGTRLVLRNQQPAPAEQGGFTARIGADERELWALSDRAFIDARGVSQGGPGEFGGQYSRALSGVGYHPGLERILLFSGSTLSSADTRLAHQAHVVDAETGELLVNGLSFGGPGMPSQISAIFYRESTQDFLLQTSDAGRNSAFFTYNGRRQIDVFSLKGKDWSEHRMLRSTWSQPHQQLFILSEPLRVQNPKTGLSVFDAQGNLAWEIELEPNVGEHGLGVADSFQVLRDYIVVNYRRGAGDYMRVLAHQSGETLRVEEFGMDALIGDATYRIEYILNPSPDELRLLKRVWPEQFLREERIEFIRGSSGPADADAGLGGADAGDAGLPPGGNDGGGGCAVSGSGALPPFSALSLAFGLLVFTIADRRRLNRIDRGDEANDRV